MNEGKGVGNVSIVPMSPAVLALKEKSERLAAIARPVMERAARRMDATQRPSMRFQAGKRSRALRLQVRAVVLATRANEAHRAFMKALEAETSSNAAEAA